MYFEVSTGYVTTLFTADDNDDNGDFVLRSNQPNPKARASDRVQPCLPRRRSSYCRGGTFANATTTAMMSVIRRRRRPHRHDSLSATPRHGCIGEITITTAAATVPRLSIPPCDDNDGQHHHRHCDTAMESSPNHYWHDDDPARPSVTPPPPQRCDSMRYQQHHRRDGIADTTTTTPR